MKGETRVMFRSGGEVAVMGGPPAKKQKKEKKDKKDKKDKKKKEKKDKKEKKAKASAML